MTKMIFPRLTALAGVAALLGLAACASEPEPVTIPDSGPPPAAAEPAVDACDEILARGRPSGDGLSLADALWDSCWRRKTAGDIWGE